MAGRLVSVITKQAISINIVNGSDTVVPLGKLIDTRDIVSGLIMVRVAASPAPSLPTGSTLIVALFNSLIAPDDPGIQYSPYGATTTAAATAFTTITQGDTGFPRLYTAGFYAASTNPIGSMCGFALIGHYGSAAAAATLTLAVDIILRDA